MNKLTKISFVIFTSMLSFRCFANSDSYDNFYFSIGGGGGIVEPLPNAGFALEANVGYDFNQYFALEAQANTMPSVQWQNNLLNTYNVINLAAKGSIPLGNVLSLYGKLGAGLGISDWSGGSNGSQDSDLYPDGGVDCSSGLYVCDGNAAAPVFLGAVGVNFKINNNLSIYAENNNFVPFGGGAGRFGYSANGIVGIQYVFKSNNATPNVVSTQTNCAENPSFSECNTVIKAESPVIHTIVIKQKTCAEDPNQDGCKIVIQVNDKHSFTYPYAEFNLRVKVLQNEDRYITIEKGDTLSSIAMKSGIGLEKLKLINNLASDKIKLGARLYLLKNK